MEYREEVRISQEQLDIINRYLTIEPTSADECLDEDESIIYTANFGNGMEMDIKCCGVQYKPDAEVGYGETNTAWSEAVLFCNGNEVGSEYGEDEFEGEWTIEYNSNTYTAVVVPA